MKNTTLVQSVLVDVLPRVGRHDDDGIQVGLSRDAGEYQLAAREGERLLRIVSQAARIKTHFELFTLLQGEIQYFVPHQILIGAWGDFLELDLDLDVISAIEGVRTSRLNDCNIKGLFKRLYLRWLADGRQPLLLEGGASELRAHPACGCALHASLRSMQSILVHGFHDARDASDSLYVAACTHSIENLPSAERSRFLMDSVIVQIDVAFRRIAGLKPSRVMPRRGTDELSVREKEILAQVSEGRTNREISAILGISTFTVKNHVQRIIRKLGAVNRTEAAAKYRNLTDGTDRSVDSPVFKAAIKQEAGLASE